LNGTPSAIQPVDRVRRALDHEFDRFLPVSAPRPRPSCRGYDLSNVSPASSTAAMPPCAQAVDPPVSVPLAMTSTRSLRRSASAAVSPAAPEPMMMTS
jgi:hypothetical protein